MTVIAWDGKTLAADKRALHSGLIMTCTKVRKIRDHLVGVCGDYGPSLMLMKWFEDGCDPKDWPECQKDKDRWSGIMVITPERKIIKYEQDPIGFMIEDKMHAVGSGRDFALMAMRLGKTAEEAIRLTFEFESGCGNGVDALMLGDA